MTNEIRVRVKRNFLSPLKPGLRGMAKVDDEMNVPQAQFWLRRIKAGDCEIIKLSKSKKAESKLKGSK